MLFELTALPLSVLLRNLRKSIASGGAFLLTAMPLPPPTPSFASPAPPVTAGNGNQPRSVPRPCLLVLSAFWAARRPLAHQLHRRLAVADRGRLVVVGRALVARLIRIERVQLEDLVAGLRAGVGVPVAALDHLLEGVTAADAEDEVRPQVHGRPHVLAGDGERNDPGRLELGDVGEEVIPGGRRRGDAGLGEEGLVVPEADHPHVPGDAVLLALVRVDAHGAGVDRAAFHDATAA